MNVVRTILITATITAPVAAHANCTDSTYRKAHPYECRTTSSGTLGAGLVLGGAALATGAVFALAGGNSSGGGGGTSIPTLPTYNFVGADVSPALLSAATATPEYALNQVQYDTIRLGYSLARGYTGQDNTIAILDSESWHGRTVADVAGGPIAPNAVIEKYIVANEVNTFISYREIGNIITSASHADIINASWNTEMRANAIHSRTQLENLTDTNFTASIINAAQNGTIFVWAAGNEGLHQSGALSAMPRVIPELQGHFINVVAWDDARGELASYSNECGVTMNYCITAPGTNITTGTRVVSGTSFAAPIVSAAVAVIKEAFPYMTAPQITALLFDTARDLGTPGVDAVYGHGMLDLERATRPVGTEVVPLASGGNAPLRTARVSGAIGQKIKATNPTLAFVDNYGRAFETPLRDHIKIKNHGRGYERLRDKKTSAHAGNVEFGFRQSDFLAADGLLGTDENNTITFIAINGEYDVGVAKFFLRPEVGATRPRGRADSMVTKFSGIYTTSVATGVGLGKWRMDVKVPDMILAGDMNMRMPVGRAANGNLLFQDTKTSLTGKPTLEYSLTYRFITAAFVDNPIGTDELFILARHRMTF